MDNPWILHGVTLTFVHATVWVLRQDNDRKGILLQTSPIDPQRRLVVRRYPGMASWISVLSSRVEGVSARKVLTVRCGGPAVPGLLCTFARP